MDDPVGADLPDRLAALLAVAVDARLVDAVLELRDVAAVACGGAGAEGDPVGGDELERLGDAVAKVVRQIDALAADGVAGPVGELHRAGGLDPLGGAVDVHPVGRERVDAVVDDDLADRRDGLGVDVVDDAVGLDQHTLVTLGRLDHAEQGGAARSLLGEGGQGPRGQDRRQRHAAERKGAQPRRVERTDDPDQRHPSSRNNKMVEPSMVATTDGVQAARAGGTRPSLPKSRAISVIT